MKKLVKNSRFLPQLINIAKTVEATNQYFIFPLTKKTPKKKKRKII